MATMTVNRLKNVEMELNEWEYEYVIDALYYFSYHALPKDDRLKKFIRVVDLDPVVSKQVFQDKYLDSETP